MKLLPATAFAAAAILAVGSFATAQNPAPAGQPGLLRAMLLKYFDANRDGTLSPAELQTANTQFKANFPEWHAKIDADHNGTISREELAGARKAARTWVMNHLDTDKDGTLSPAERQAAAKRFEEKHPDLHAKVDQNDDGRINRKELSQALIALPGFLVNTFDADRSGTLDDAERTTMHSTIRQHFGH